MGSDILVNRLTVAFGEGSDAAAVKICKRVAIQENAAAALETMAASSFSVCLNGKYSPDSVLAVLGANIPAGQACKITIEVALLA